MRQKCYVFVLIGAVILMASGYQSGSHGWVQVLEVKGSASKQTDRFEIKGGKWRIRWNKTAESELSIYAYGKDETSYEASVQTVKETEGESFVHKSGNFYLSILSTGNYQITVDDWR